MSTKLENIQFFCPTPKSAYLFLDYLMQYNKINHLKEFEVGCFKIKLLSIQSVSQTIFS